MDNGHEQDIGALLARAGLAPSPADTEQLKAIWEEYLERLKLLHAADLDDEEVAGFFIPGGEQG